MDPVRAVSGWTFTGQVLSAPLPVLVVFSTSPGDRGDQFRALAAEYASRAEVVTVSIEREPELSRCFLNGDGPAILLFRDGRVADGCRYDAPPEQLRALLNRTLGAPQSTAGT